MAKGKTITVEMKKAKDHRSGATYEAVDGAKAVLPSAYVRKELGDDKAEPIMPEKITVTLEVSSGKG